MFICGKVFSLCFWNYKMKELVRCPTRVNSMFFMVSITLNKFKTHKDRIFLPFKRYDWLRFTLYCNETKHGDGKFHSIITQIEHNSKCSLFVIPDRKMKTWIKIKIESSHFLILDKMKDACLKTMMLIRIFGMLTIHWAKLQTDS